MFESKKIQILIAHQKEDINGTRKVQLAGKKSSAKNCKPTWTQNHPLALSCVGIIFGKEKGNTFTILIIFTVKSLQKRAK